MSTRFVDTAPRLYRVTKWSIAPSWYLSIEAEAVEGTDDPHLFIDGYCTSHASRLTITNRKGWSSDLIIYREDWFLDNAAQTKANIKH